MGKFIINGGRALCGDIRVSGSKNAALPIIFASILTDGVSEIRGLPYITDVSVALDIISGFGAHIRRCQDITYIDTRELHYSRPDDKLTSALRASTYLIGACLSRFGRAEIQSFGGCNFSRRPIDMHLSAAESFGADISGDILTTSRLKGAEIKFAKKSVGATVNALIMASSAEGETRLSGCACEPHIMTLIEYLRSAGALIEITGDNIRVDGAQLRGAAVNIPGDMIEAGTYMALSALCGGRIRVSGFDKTELSSFLNPLIYSGAEVITDGAGVTLCTIPDKWIDIVTEAYPGFPTDLQPIFSILLAMGRGGSIRETVWEGRFGYLSELAKLGMSYSISAGKATIYPSEPESAVVRALDLRGGAAGVLLALAASGQSRVEDGEKVMRGYESFVDKLRSVGADICYRDD